MSENKSSFTVDEIKKLCLEYDIEFGSYPESTYEGLSLFEYITKISIITADWENDIDKVVCVKK